MLAKALRETASSACEAISNPDAAIPVDACSRCATQDVYRVHLDFVSRCRLGQTEI